MGMMTYLFGHVQEYFCSNICPWVLIKKDALVSGLGHMIYLLLLNVLQIDSSQVDPDKALTLGQQSVVQASSVLTQSKK